MLTYDFMRNAFAAAGIVAIVSGLVGYILVLRSQTFAGHALAHVGFSGATGAVLIGVAPLWGMIGATIAAGVAMGAIGERLAQRDVAIGVILSLSLGLGLLFLHFYTSGAAQATALLFGNVLAVDRATVGTLAALGAGILAALSLIARPLVFASLQPELAEARGVDLRRYAMLFLALVAVTTAACAQIVGVLLVFTLMVGPAAAAHRLTRTVGAGMALAAALALAEAWAGITLAYYTDFPSSFWIATLSAAGYLASGFPLRAMSVAAALFVCASPAVAQDRALTTPNTPRRDPLPVVAAATPGDGLQLTPGARNAFSLVMGGAQRGANMTTAQSIRDVFFLNYMTGDLNRAIGSPMDTGQANNNAFAAVARHFPPGDPDDLHVMAADGMHLRAVCSKDHTDCSPGHVWGAMVRLPFEWRPGSVLKVRYKSPKGDHAWAPIWFFSGSQIPPAPDESPYAGFQGPAAYYRAGTTGLEIDWNDNFSRVGDGVPTGYQVDFGTPDIYGAHWQTRPHAVYWANGDGYQFFAKGPPFERLPFDWSAGFHDLVGNWRGDGSNLIDLFVDGRLIATTYMEYPQVSYTDPADGAQRPVAMHLLIGNQAIPSFSPGARTATDNDGIPDGWTIVVQEISGWTGGIADPDSYRASATSGVR